MSIKYISLLALAVQNSALILVMRQSRTAFGPKYMSTTAVIVCEAIKTLFSSFFLLCSSVMQVYNIPGSHNHTLPVRTTWIILPETSAELTRTETLIPMLIPAILYTVQNNLQYLAASNLDAATFAVLYQGKILTTAFFAMMFLRMRLSATRWIGILILTAGIVLISYPSDTGVDSSNNTTGNVRIIGLLSISGACILSGFAGTFVESLLKRANPSQNSSDLHQLWVRNVQLGAASTIMACIFAGFVDGSAILGGGFFGGYNRLVWSTIMLQAVGGLIVSVVLTYADNIVKGFATSLSLVASTVISAVMGDCVLTQKFMLGVATILAATNIYAMAQESSHTDAEHAYHSASEKADNMEFSGVDITHSVEGGQRSMLKC